MALKEINSNPKLLTIKELDDYTSKITKYVKPKTLNEEIISNQKENPFISYPINKFSSEIFNLNYSQNEPDNLSINGNTKEELERIIISLKAQNNELKNDIKKLFYLTDQNKNELENNLKCLSEENLALKRENIELKNKISIQENIIQNYENNKEEIANEQNNLKKKLENEIIQLNFELNECKRKLKAISFDYQNLTQSYHKKKEENYLDQNRNFMQYSSKEEEKKQSTIDEIRGSKDKHNFLQNKTEKAKQKNKSFFGKDFSRNTNVSYIKKINTSSKVRSPNRKGNFNSTSKKKRLLGSSSLNNSKIKYTIRASVNLPNNKIKRNLCINNNNNKTIDNSSLNYIEEEIINLEERISDLNVSYQIFQSKLQKMPDGNFIQLQELNKTLFYLENTINSKNERLRRLKEKQQELLIKSFQ